ncbi:MBL fold metallo-hydrolase [Cohnella ginsengisoli]|uniref:MBL fold metallo-hydrolase n=1 Tax=Cohnella ginsengisoli TaxID=425004 RepID=A0A9X4QR87_9BACL|nr:MBL fold metallo-hydrolase [Cohnella ginsengisoli]MDG0794600.1 MBL fold metallo-hydrolase [Cohnella ginsengisoli]
MKVQYLKSASVLVEHEGVRVLCDPWLTDGIYYGSWYHYPPLEITPEDFSDVDYIYISHVHPDHLDPETLRRLPDHIPVLIANYKDRFVHRILKQCGFEQIIELQGHRPYRLADDFSIEVLGADFCDPALCGHSFCVPARTGQGHVRA